MNLRNAPAARAGDALEALELFPRHLERDEGRAHAARGEPGDRAQPDVHGDFVAGHQALLPQAAIM